MNSTYLIGATEPPAENYEKNLSEVWAWDEPAISGGVDFSFDRGAIVLTLDDLHAFARALMAGDLFQKTATLDEMLTVPEDIKGIFYASGLIVFPTNEGRVMYMMGSNGTWVEYFPPLDLVMIGTTNDFSNMPGQFMLHGEIYQVLASHGLITPMARLYGLPMLLVMLCMVLTLALYVIWLIVILRKKRMEEVVPGSVKLGRWLTFAAFLTNLLMMGLIGMTVSGNPFQMSFGFSPQVRMLFTITGLLMGGFSIVMLTLAAQLWQRREGRLFDRNMLTTIIVVTLTYAISMSVLGL
jgi:hypothetical protein